MIGKDIGEFGKGDRGWGVARSDSGAPEMHQHFAGGGELEGAGPGFYLDAGDFFVFFN